MLVKSANSRCSRALINSCLAETEAVHADDDLRSGQLYELFMKKNEEPKSNLLSA